MKEAVTVKQQQITAKKYGVMKDISYEGFLKSLLQENERRRSALQNRQVIYGPKEYDERGYFEYIFDNMVSGLKAKWSQTDLNMPEEQLRLYYESVKDRQYKNTDTITLEKLSISYSGRTPEEMSAQRMLASQSMLAIKKDMDQGSIEEKQDRNRKEDRIKMVSEMITLDPESSGKNLILAPLMMETAFTLKTGQTSEILEEDASFLILRCVERKEGGYKPFEANRDLVRSNYVDSEYAEFVNQQVKSVPYTTNKSVYDSFVIS
ncbi:peptidylprolyl isomerase [Paenibacillus sp. N3.4]|uniref:peptidylprolyl isomerase n=1 Tax=Paenibacillus sp. N3.4 TaxID=2603222 RepID=UPI0011C8E09D|nr:peptidylprolyl isomerase [Paenibacillus sp. N3.4]TXK84156.1 peptidyl-prolyl cis-trans isomerase [Paenibacillus sp. N3.4]